MYPLEKISSSEATRLISHIVAEVEINNKQVAIAVTGPEGELIAFLRMDGASPAASLIAQNKAYTAARDRKASQVLVVVCRSFTTKK
jgi:glc operon protein GlcG